VTLKTLVTGVAAAALVGGAAAGVTSIAYPGDSPTAVAIKPVVWDIPIPQAPNQDLEPALRATLIALAGPGSFGPKGNKSAYIEGGIGRIEGVTADRAYANAAAKGYFPLDFQFGPIEQNGPSAAADVTAVAPNGASATQNVQFVQDPNGNWLITKESALALLSAVG
jgi:hypothetical protein